MAANPVSKLSITEFLEMERAAESRSEYLDGVVYPGVAATLEHGVIAANLTKGLGNLLGQRPCLVAANGAYVLVSESSFLAFPDIVVLCEAPIHGEGAWHDAITNPAVIVEVLSPSTEAWDRGMKFKHYRKIPALREYVLVSQAEYSIDVYRRAEDRWSVLTFEGPEAELRLESIGCCIPLKDIYRKVEFDAAWS